MKHRLLISVAVAALVASLAQAQTTVNPKAKVDPKNNKVSKPVVDKPKPVAVVMSRYQIRECQEINERIESEELALPPLIKAFDERQDELKKAMDDSNKATDDFNKMGATLNDDVVGLNKANELLLQEQKEGKTKKDEMLKKIKDFDERRIAVQARIDDYNKLRETLLKNKAALDVRVGPHNESKVALNERIEALKDDKTDHKAKCVGKEYEEADWKAVAAERAKAKAAAVAASAAK
ncbi:hypothetical protein [Pelomonas sp. SE-A7]|uniref:hypothetical protein n=1 Tax=Pelomonas sp. SE-A7 TaxID=3054953 RepID=UPI00259C9775|nr:hypothetical protein [Pelomonas sp. SE-A7]MDM4765599.1 hypothetical protein [Pelomonas sp. SE-A7]